MRLKEKFPLQPLKETNGLIFTVHKKTYNFLKSAVRN